MGKILVYGHQENKTALIHAVQKKRLQSSLLFVGPASVGKKQMAFYLAQTLLCLESNKPCGFCSSCLKVEKEEHTALLVIKPDPLTIKLSAVDRIRSFLKLQSFSSCRIIIIDQAHTMNVQTQNALLKTLEEPPKNVYLILICDRENLILKTIQSRVLKYRFYSLKLEDMKKMAPDQKTSILYASRGQIHRIRQWEGEEDLLKEVFCFWQDLLNKKGMSHQLTARLRERKTACLTAQVWQEILRDVRVYQEGFKDWIHLDQQALYKKLSLQPRKIIDQLYQKALYLEQDVFAYLNSLLCFENYRCQAHQLLHGS